MRTLRRRSCPLYTIFRWDTQPHLFEPWTTVQALACSLGDLVWIDVTCGPIVPTATLTRLALALSLGWSRITPKGTSPALLSLIPERPLVYNGVLCTYSERQYKYCARTGGVSAVGALTGDAVSVGRNRLVDAG